MLPFLIGAQEARRLVGDWLKGLWFAPSGIAELARGPGRLHGVYLPYWTFDSRTRTRYAGQRGDVKNHVRTFHRLLACPWVANVGDLKVDAVGYLVEIVPEAGHEVIDHPDIVSELEQSSDNVRAYETGAAGDQRASWGHEN